MGNFDDIIDELSHVTIDFAILAPGSKDMNDLDARFESMVQFNQVAEIDWNGHQEGFFFSSAVRQEVFDAAKIHLRGMLSADLRASDISIIPFDGNCPLLPECGQVNSHAS